MGSATFRHKCTCYTHPTLLAPVNAVGGTFEYERESNRSDPPIACRIGGDWGGNFAFGTVRQGIIASGRDS